ncbi:hypothetical protein [Neobacillus sp. CF12]|nr:hypothetical protein [Neobacillus sp. CF12]MDM5327806.1 hypothetical protein [Neobacillus sp. CF12]
MFKKSLIKGTLTVPIALSLLVSPTFTKADSNNPMPASGDIV